MSQPVTQFYPLPPQLRALQFDNCMVRSLPIDTDTSRQARQVQQALCLIAPEPVPAPELLAYSEPLAAELGLDAQTMHSAAMVQVMAGNHVLPQMQPFASNYGGHQFGHWAGQLGDGRAITLGELVTAQGQRYELQLKGAGRTPFSRHADGRAVLRSSIREMICSEAMDALGVPTTRALCLVGSPLQVLRDVLYDGHPAYETAAILCRAAPSFLRFGHFQLPAARGDGVLLEKWLEFCIARDFPHLQNTGKDGYLQWFLEVAERTMALMVHWLRVGFVHGVMNTDNMSVLGLTIDYGPYGWLEAYDPQFTPNTSDLPQKRYRYAAQPQIAYWNLSQLAAALAQSLPNSTAALQQILQQAGVFFQHAEQAMMAEKLGFAQCDDAIYTLMRDVQQLMAQAHIDYTLFFSVLSRHPLQEINAQIFSDCFYDADKRTAFWQALTQWLKRYRDLQQAYAVGDTARQHRMQNANPVIVPRNWQVQQVIAQAQQGQYAPMMQMLAAFRAPYSDAPAQRAYAVLRPASADSGQLSCSS